jgi:hypothetical protein
MVGRGGGGQECGVWAGYRERERGNADVEDHSGTGSTVCVEAS